MEKLLRLIMVEFNHKRVQEHNVPAQDKDRYASVYVSRQKLDSLSCAERELKT